jgi:hypothetical protein
MTNVSVVAGAVTIVTVPPAALPAPNTVYSVVMVCVTSTPVAVVTNVTTRSSLAKNRYGNENAVVEALPTSDVLFVVVLKVNVLSPDWSVVVKPFYFNSL